MLLPTANRTPTSVYTLLHTPCIIFMHIPVWTLSLRKHARRSVCVSLCKCTPLERHSMATNPIHPENMNSYCCGLAFFSQDHWLHHPTSAGMQCWLDWHSTLTISQVGTVLVAFQISLEWFQQGCGKNWPCTENHVTFQGYVYTVLASSPYASEQ